MHPSPLPCDLKTGILHLGLGAFHRAHQAFCTQEAIAAKGGDWGIEAVATLEPTLAHAINAQGGRYTLITRHPDGPQFQDMTVIRKAHVLPGHVMDVAQRMADPAIHIVTLTVTEKGYGANVGTQTLDRSHAKVAHDLASQNQNPQSIIGLICCGLELRRAKGLGGMTIMSCDNLPDNGRILEKIVLEFSQEVDPDLCAWIKRTCRFPLSMVDRITPAARQETFDMAQAELGKMDLAAIETEPFCQWVIEDNFAGPRPAWEAAGVQIVRDVEPYEEMKHRMLNGSHSMIAYLGVLSNMPAVRDTMADENFRALVMAHMMMAARSLTMPEGFNAANYAQSLIERFANPEIDYRCIQITIDGSQKFPQRIFAPAKVLIEAGENSHSFALVTAAWIRFMERCHGTEGAYVMNDPMSEQLREALENAGPMAQDKVAALANLPGLIHFGVLFDAEFSDDIAYYLDQLTHNGAAATIFECLRDLEGEDALERQ